jgi:hypothetical protein
MSRDSSVAVVKDFLENQKNGNAQPTQKAGFDISPFGKRGCKMEPKPRIDFLFPQLLAMAKQLAPKAKVTLHASARGGGGSKTFLGRTPHSRASPKTLTFTSPQEVEGWNEDHAMDSVFSWYFTIEP